MHGETVEVLVRLAGLHGSSGSGGPGSADGGRGRLGRSGREHTDDLLNILRYGRQRQQHRPAVDSDASRCRAAEPDDDPEGADRAVGQRRFALEPERGQCLPRRCRPARERVLVRHGRQERQRHESVECPEADGRRRTAPRSCTVAGSVSELEPERPPRIRSRRRTSTSRFGSTAPATTVRSTRPTRRRRAL